MTRPPQRLVALAVTAAALATAAATSGPAVAGTPAEDRAAAAATDFALPYVARVRAVVDLGERAVVVYSTTELPGRAQPAGTPRMGVVVLRFDRRGRARAENGLSEPFGSAGRDPAGFLRAPVPGGATAGGNLVTVTPPAQYDFVASRRAAFVAVISRRPLRLQAAARPAGAGRRILRRGRTTVTLERRAGAWVAMLAVGSRSDRDAILASVDPAGVAASIASLPR
jgi:hypothetical protein